MPPTSLSRAQVPRHPSLLRLRRGKHRVLTAEAKEAPPRRGHVLVRRSLDTVERRWEGSHIPAKETPSGLRPLEETTCGINIPRLGAHPPWAPTAPEKPAYYHTAGLTPKRPYSKQPTCLDSRPPLGVSYYSYPPEYELLITRPAILLV